MSDAPAAGIVIVDKPSGWTSHQVVGRMRRLAGTRKVGHAGTLDPMATGVLVVGLNRATRLLGHLAGHDKTYEATIRLGQATFTDDAEGEVISETPAPEVDRDLLNREVATLTGDILQTPSTVSAIKVDGQRAYARARRGETVELAARPVTVTSFRVVDIRSARTRTVPVTDVDVVVDCSTGTYIRSLARDLGQALGVGGHLTALRRTRVGPFGVSEALPPGELDAPTGPLPVLSPGEAAARAFPTLALSASEAAAVRHGRPLPLPVETLTALLFEGELYALYEPGERGSALPAAVFVS
ncbi:tRNA pseudouridine(55) synthase TruB [Propionicicella superfundia]|uniref:tRNA pseudouridine(55) synthase TruB n=1 Tax=Propionicicella superfundia TaxID=348582 RepID=UPI00040147F4|nr:tRNA pseudouridine(55) synthase TruB [Propionicicella superfundia]